MTLSETIDRFINKAQGKIGNLGNEIVYKKMNDDDCYEKQLFLIEELSAAIGLLQCCCSPVTANTNEALVETDTCEILTDNEKYQIMSYLIDKADLDSLPLLPYGSICVSNKIIIGEQCCNSDPTELLFTTDIPVVLKPSNSFGKWLNGQTIPAIGKSARQVIIEACLEDIDPGITMGLQFGNLFQKGIPVTSVQVNYTITSGTGLITSRKILKNAAIVNYPSSNNGSFTHTGQNIIWSDSSANRTYSFQVNYSNFSTQTVTSTISFIAPSYYGVGSTTLLNSVTTVAGMNTALPGSQELRTNKSRGTTTFNPSLQRYFFCYPAILGNLASIIDQNGFNVTAGFTLTTKNITLADGTIESYNIYMSNDDTTQTNFTLTFN